MAEHRDASVLVLHRCEDEEHTRRFFFLCTARTKISQSQTEWHEHWRRPAKDTQGQRTRRSSLQLFLMPCCPLTYKFTFYACKISTTQTHTHTRTHTDKQIQMAWGRQSRMDLGTSFRLDALIQASPALLCPQAFPDWPVEWATYPDSNTVWQGDLETDVPCHWHGADEEMVSHVRTVICVCEDGGRDRQREKLNAWLAMLGGRKEEQQWVVVMVAGGGCKRRNKSSQSNLWQ